LGRQLGSAAITSLVLGAFVGGVMCVVIFSENLAGDVVDVNGHLDLGFIARIFLMWFAPISAGAFLVAALAILAAAALRTALRPRS
jgi:hypothetical protein